MNAVRFSKRSILTTLGLVTVLAGLLVPSATAAVPTPGSDPNNAIAMALVPGQNVLMTGQLAAGQEMWYAVTVSDVEGRYANIEVEDGRNRPPVDLTLFVTPIDGNTGQQIRMEIFPGSYAQHWSHGHIYRDGLSDDDQELLEHAAPFGAGTWVDRVDADQDIYNRYGDQRVGQLTWSGRVIDNDTFLVRIQNGNGSTVDYTLYTGNVFEYEQSQAATSSSALATETAALSAETAVASVAAGSDPNNPIPMALIPDQSVVNTGQLGAGQEMWYAVTVSDVEGRYANIEVEDGRNRPPVDLTLFFTPVDGNTAQQISMEIFQGNYAQHWSHGHVYRAGLSDDEQEDLEHAAPFGAGTWVDRVDADQDIYNRYGDQSVGQLTWSGRVIDNDTFLVRIRNGNGTAVDYALFTNKVFEYDQSAAPTTVALPAVAAVARVAAGTDPNHAIPMALVPGQSVVKSGLLAAGQEMWYAVTVSDVEGRYANIEVEDGRNRPPVDLTLFFSPVDGNTAQQISMEIFQGNYAQHWSHGHVYRAGLSDDEQEDLEHAAPFGAGTWVDRVDADQDIYNRQGDSRIGQLNWSGRVIDNDTFLVRIRNGNGSAVNYTLFSDKVFELEF